MLGLTSTQKGECRGLRPLPRPGDSVLCRSARCPRPFFLTSTPESGVQGTTSSAGARGVLAPSFSSTRAAGLPKARRVNVRTQPESTCSIMRSNAKHQRERDNVQHRYALIIGIDYYNDNSHFIPLTFAQDDAQALYNLLID